MLAGMAGCGPDSETDPAWLETRQSEIEQHKALRQTMQGDSGEKAAIKMVKESGAIDEKGTTEEWLDRQVNLAKSMVLFPRWEVSRRGMGRYEVRFTYTMMDENSGVVRKGFAWETDLVARNVGPPREMNQTELTQHPTEPF